MRPEAGNKSARYSRNAYVVKSAVPLPMASGRNNHTGHILSSVAARAQRQNSLRDSHLIPNER